jgi:hypothetical protein
MRLTASIIIVSPRVMQKPMHLAATKKFVCTTPRMVIFSAARRASLEQVECSPLYVFDRNHRPAYIGNEIAYDEAVQRDLIPQEETAIEEEDSSGSWVHRMTRKAI